MRVRLLKVIAGAVAIPLAIVADSAPVSGQDTRRMVQIAKDVYTFTGGGSNASFVVTNDGVLVFDADIRNNDLPAIRKAGIKLGISTHTPEELQIALAAEPDHVALGPIYETTLKAMQYPPQGLDRIREWKGRIACPLVAIGGITLERAPAVFQAGADSIAVVTDIVGHPTPEQRVADWLAAS